MTRSARYLFAVLFSLALLGLVPSAHAVDGTVLINQSTSLSGLPGCPHSGFPILICQSGSYRLSGNLTVTTANIDAIDVSVNGVTIDLNGFSIIGPMVCSSSNGFVSCDSGVETGIRGGSHNLTVMNGTLRGWALAVNLNVGTVDRVNVSNNDNGIVVTNGIASHNVATLNKFGIIVINGVTIENFATSNNNGLTVGCPSTVVNNTVTGNTISDISFTTPTGCALANNVGQ